MNTALSGTIPCHYHQPPRSHVRRYLLNFVVTVLAGVCVSMPTAQAQPTNLLCDAGLELSTPNGVFPNSGCWSPAWLYQAGSLCTSTASRSGNCGFWQYTGNDAASWWSGPYQQFPASEDYAYQATAWICTPFSQSWPANSRAVVRLLFLDAAGAVLATHESPALTSGDAGWAKYETATVSPPAGVASVRFVSYLERPSGSSGQCVVNVDDCELLEVAVPPSIIQPPTDQTVVEGSTVSFSITARGTPPLYYQWQFRGTNLPGATDATLTLTAVTTNQAGPYAVFVSNAVGSTGCVTQI